MLLLPFLGENHLSDDTENRSYMVFNEKVKKKGKPIVTDGFHRNRGQPTVLTKNERHGLQRRHQAWKSKKVIIEESLQRAYKRGDLSLFEQPEELCCYVIHKKTDLVLCSTN